MTPDGSRWPSDAVSGNFDLLRVRLETTFAKPAVVVVAATTTADGGEVVARGLASSFARSGYSTLFVDTSPDARNVTKSRAEFLLDEMGPLSSPDPKSGIVSVVAMRDRTPQRMTSQRDVQSALSEFRNKFDYVLVSADYSASKSFATSLFTAADATVVSVTKGRRESADDTRLAAALESIGSRFLGVIAVTLEVERPSFVGGTFSTPINLRREHRNAVEKDLQHRKNAESTT